MEDRTCAERLHGSVTAASTTRTPDGAWVGVFKGIGLRYFSGLCLCLGLFLCLGLMSPQVQARPYLPTYAQVKASYRASDLLILDRRGELIQRVRDNFHERRGDWLALHEISPALVRAVLLSEDRRFHDHEGVDWLAVGGAAWGRLIGKGRGGASTISMQVADLVQAHQRPKGGRDFLQKIDQMRRAGELEQGWSKQQILEAYLNLAPWRGELIGVDALSRVLFQKYASGLNLRESALAAAMLRSPNASAARLRERACALLQEMSAPHECKNLRDFVESVIARRSAPRWDAEGLAPHFARWVLSAKQDHQGGKQLITSLDAQLQRHVLAVLNRHLHALSSYNVRDGAVVVLDNMTGEVLAYVGSSGQLSDAPWVDHARALRQAGSTLKPFLYEQALEQRRLTAVSLLLDGPLDVDTGAGVYAPRNYNEGYAGWVSARNALASSLNVPAVRVLTMVGPEQFARRLTDLGLPLNHNGDFYGYSLALGSAEVTLLSLTNAYRALANLGGYSALTGTPAVAASTDRLRRVMAEGPAWIVGDILSDSQARARTFGLDSSLTTPFWTAVKTGTSKDMRDNWCIGFSARYTVGVWAGNSGGESMRHISGVSGAGPVWQDVMGYLHGEGTNASRPAMPSTIVSQKVRFDGVLEPTRIDHFLEGTEQSVIRLASNEDGRAKPSIVQPVDGTILALDPDIPPAHQRLQLVAAGLQGSKRGVEWRIGGTVIADQPVAMWMPSPGLHRIELTDAKGATLDSVHISVRGAAPKLK